MIFSKIAVIADDLTGATDTGVQFCQFGLTATVFLGQALPLAIVKKTDVMVLDTDSRPLSGAQAAERAAGACRRICGAGINHIYKKIDSTLRGHVSWEIAAIHKELRPDAVIIAPAYPPAGRGTVGGYQLLKGLPISLTEFASDPQTPVKEAFLPTILGGGNDIGRIPLEIVMQGKAAIEESIRSSLASGKNWLIIDAVTEENLLSIAWASLILKKVLWVGSAGLAGQLPVAMGYEKQKTAAFTSGAHRVLVVAGSANTITNGQVAAFGEACGLKPVVASPQAALADAGKEAARLVQAVLDMPATQDAVITCSAERLPDMAAASTALANVLGLAAAGLSGCFDGFFLTGGDTAVSVCRTLDASGIEIVREVSPGIPLGRLVGGKCHGLPVVTKAGGFGDQGAIIDAVRMLKS